MIRRLNSAILIIFTLLFLIAVFPAASQDQINPTAFLVYYDDDFELEIFDSAGEYIGDVFTGMELFPGSTVKTYNSTAEIQLDPNGSILKISENSVFQIEAFQRTADESNDFSLFNGKLRVIAARAGLGFENYSIVTQSAVCGVRGTDFVIDSIGKLAVKDGAVSFSSLLNGDTIDVLGGQVADVFADVFTAAAVPASQLGEYFNDMQFKGVDPGQVPGHTVTPDEPEEETEKEAEEEEPQAPEEKAVEEPEAEAETAPEPSAGSAAGIISGKPAARGGSGDSEGGNEEKKAAEPGPFDDLLSDIGDFLGFEIGSVTIDGETYAKAVMQPQFEIGKFRAGLYLPVIYQDNLFDPDSWYHPSGNDEWSFGTDQNGWVDVSLDVVSDLFLKIRYLQWGDNGDDFYLKFGNLSNMTIGHGILMYNYANDTEFPAIRKVGLNTGMKFEYIDFEAVIDDASAPSIFGGRFVVKPMGTKFPLGFGLSAVADINPDSELDSDSGLFDPMFVNPSFDIELPLSMINMTLFADTATMIPYIDGSFESSTFYNAGASDFSAALNNYGIATGFYGDVFGLDYRLEYRYSKGLFTPAFYNSNYDRNKTSYYNAILAYLDNPGDESYQTVTMGVYGELGMNFFDALALTGGYLWPWQLDGDTVSPADDDYFILSLELMPDVIPVVGLYGSVSYIRTNLASSIRDTVDGAAFQLFDTDTIFNGELVYPFSNNLDVALQFATALSRDNNGNITEDSEVYYAFTIDTRVHF